MTKLVILVFFRHVYYLIMRLLWDFFFSKSASILKLSPLLGTRIQLSLYHCLSLQVYLRKAFCQLDFKLPWSYSWNDWTQWNEWQILKVLSKKKVRLCCYFVAIDFLRAIFNFILILLLTSSSLANIPLE